MMTRFLLPILVFAIMIPIFIIGLGRNKSELPSPLISAPAPTFALPSLQDANVTVGSDNYNGSTCDHYHYHGSSAYAAVWWRGYCC